MPAVKSFDPKVISLLQEKIKLIKTEKEPYILSAPLICRLTYLRRLSSLSGIAGLIAMR
jgi:hypothetical protein